MTLRELLGLEWTTELLPTLRSRYMPQLLEFIAMERLKKEIIPEQGSILTFKAFRDLPPSKVKVVILGQDPYSDRGSYDGYAFSNPISKLSTSPSLRNILKEVERDIYNGMDIAGIADHHLYRWVEQGVLLINVAHTVPVGTPGGHVEVWKPFTLQVVASLQKYENIIWMLWGNFAQSYEKFISSPSHCVIKSGHPSPLNTSNPFVGCGCFSQCNEQLRAKQLTEIIW